MELEDELDYDFNTNRKNMVIIIMLVLVILFFYMAYTQKIEDNAFCDARISQITLRNLTLDI